MNRRRFLKRLDCFNRFKSVFRLNKLKKSSKSVKSLKKCIDEKINGHCVVKRQTPWKVEDMSSRNDNGGNEQTGNENFEEKLENVSHFRAPRENTFYDDWLRSFERSDESVSENDDLDVSFADYETSGATESDVFVVDPRRYLINPSSDEEEQPPEERKPDEEEEESENDQENEIEETDRCKFYALNDEVFALALFHPVSVAIRGQISMRVISGQIDIGGYILDATRTDFVPVSSIDRHGVQSLWTLSDETTKENLWLLREVLLENGALKNDIVSLSNVPGAVVLFRKHYDRINSYLEYVYEEPMFKTNEHLQTASIPSESYGCSFSFKKGGRLQRGKRWKVIRKSIDNYIKSNRVPPRIIVCGATRVGKSTLCRYLTNYLLNVTDTVSWLDCDPGQTEFTPAGTLSLVDVDEPLLGPSFTHQKEPNLMLFAGGISAADSPSHYVSCIEKLVECRDEKNRRRHPLIVNTMGWIQGIGLSILADIYTLVKPTHIIQINSSRHSSVAFPKLTMEYMSNTTGWRFGVPKQHNPIAFHSLQATFHRTYKTQVKATRDIGLVSYLARLQSSNGPFCSVNELLCYRVPWSSVALHVCHKNVPISQTLYVYNGNLVALCRCNPEEIVSTADPTFPKFLVSAPVVECFGYGIVRGINMTQKCFYVTTSVCVDLLKQTNAMLVGGGLQVPVSILKQQSVNTCIPYLSVPGMNGVYAVLDGRHIQQLKVTGPGIVVQPAFLI